LTGKEFIMKIGIIGTRGIPNHYGGFEELATKLAVGLVQRGHNVTVYNTHDHAYRDSLFFGVNIRHCYAAGKMFGSAGQFIYDFNCIRHARKQDYDVILFLGYTSSSVFHNLFPPNSLIITNMDGMEWKRSKYNRLTRSFLQHAEKLAVRWSDVLVADSVIIKEYLDKKYSVNTFHISYGADIPGEFDHNPDEFEKRGYDMLVARMEKENNVEMILDGYSGSDRNYSFLVVGSTDSGYGKYLRRKYMQADGIIFAGPIYDKSRLQHLILNSRFYFHGHSVGGTNPSLLEAMACGAFVIAHDNSFNRAVLNTQEFYFSNAMDVTNYIDKGLRADSEQLRQLHKERIEQFYRWADVIMAYEALFEKLLIERSSSRVSEEKSFQGFTSTEATV